MEPLQQGCPVSARDDAHVLLEHVRPSVELVSRIDETEQRERESLHKIQAIFEEAEQQRLKSGEAPRLKSGEAPRFKVLAVGNRPLPIDQLPCTDDTC